MYESTVMIMTVGNKSDRYQTTSTVFWPIYSDTVAGSSYKSFFFSSRHLWRPVRTG